MAVVSVGVMVVVLVRMLAPLSVLVLVSAVARILSGPHLLCTPHRSHHTLLCDQLRILCQVDISRKVKPYEYHSILGHSRKWLVSVWVALLEVVCPRILIDQTLSACVRCSSCMTSIHSAQASMCHLGTADTVHCLNQNILVCI
jgi:hypothetical protein